MSKKEKKPFLVEFNATVGRTTEEAEHPPVYLTFYAVVEAVDSDGAQDQLTQYSDPTFTTKVRDITPMDDEAKEALFANLALDKVMTETLGG